MQHAICLLNNRLSGPWHSAGFGGVTCAYLDPVSLDNICTLVQQIARFKMGTRLGFRIFERYISSLKFEFLHWSRLASLSILEYVLDCSQNGNCLSHPLLQQRLTLNALSLNALRAIYYTVLSRYTCSPLQIGTQTIGVILSYIPRPTENGPPNESH